MIKTKILIDGRQVQIHAQRVKGQLWVHFDGQTFVQANENETQRRKKSGAGGNASEVAAPMPGKVTKVLKNVGDPVKKGDAVLVMEAMKMEYTLKADAEGQVKTVQCKVGEQVTLGKVLMQFTLAPATEGAT